jgi:amidase
MLTSPKTAGSIVFPAELNNVVGFKPTRGLIGTDGAIPISGRQDVIGTLTRTVKDAAHMLSVMAGRSEDDPRTWDIPFATIPNYAAFCEITDLSGINIGVPRNAINDDAQPSVLRAFEDALAIMRSAGANVVDNTNFTGAEEYAQVDGDVKNRLRSAEFKKDMKAYLDTLQTNPNDIHSLEDIIEFTKTHPEEDYPAKGVGNFEWTRKETTEVGDSVYNDIIKQERYYGGEAGILGALEEHKVDVLVVPTWLGHANDVAARMGFPVMTVPLGYWPEGTAIEKGNGELIWRAPGIP